MSSIFVQIFSFIGDNHKEFFFYSLSKETDFKIEAETLDA